MNILIDLIIVIVIIIIALLVGEALSNDSLIEPICKANSANRNLIESHCNIWSECECNYLDNNSLLVTDNYEKINNNFYLKKATVLTK